MVSIRRRKLLGSGRSNPFLAPLPKFSENGYTPEIRMQNTKPFSVHPIPSNDVDETKEKLSPLKASGSSNVPACTELKEQHTRQFPEVKRRKRHRRKHFENQEQCVMRGVYFKNMKWQAAIKVDKKQIHLGTVGSQEEAARLYDRAAFMCGREPNFELSEEEKQELRNFKWDEFLAITRSAINHKKHHRRNGAGSRRKPESMMLKRALESEEGGNGLSGSEDTAEPDTSGS
ncbi:ethylene-responsive transcription factor-like protein At4g13040 [Coffea eugenioides]|uniref:ethylene-responsive transcription factor-like protein At4g13040 n=1 Tax=Coffea eugenioides TaxID=49369 RepID=UPI000F615655|nr:ethylene-responsive transcription factor-like protein At4g13040 [Coffea eugenioides]